MRTLAVVPIKSLARAKQRLGKALAEGSRHSLVQAMLADMVAALRRVERVEAIAVVTDDVEVEAVARGEGVVLLRDEVRAGQSEATMIGIRHAEQHGFDRVLLVPGDTPLVSPPELDELLERSERDALAVAIVPDRHGTGTNALVIQPPGAFEPSFGPDSRERHEARAREGGLAHRVEPVASLALDIDTPSDLVELWRIVDSSPRGAQRTRGALLQLERSGSRGRVVHAAGRGHDAPVEVS